MKITYRDTDGNKIPIVPIRIEADTIIYHVPSTLTFQKSIKEDNSTTDFYTHAGGGLLAVERYFLELEGEEFPDGYNILAERAKEIPACSVRPTRLPNGFSMISYEESSEDGEPFVRLCCELCSVRGKLLAAVLYSANIHLDDIGKADVIFHARIIKHMGKMTEWWEEE